MNSSAVYIWVMRWKCEIDNKLCWMYDFSRNASWDPMMPKTKQRNKSTKSAASEKCTKFNKPPNSSLKMSCSKTGAFCHVWSLWKCQLLQTFYSGFLEPEWQATKAHPLMINVIHAHWKHELTALECALGAPWPTDNFLPLEILYIWLILILKNCQFLNPNSSHFFGIKAQSLVLVDFCAELDLPLKICFLPSSFEEGATCWRSTFWVILPAGRWWWELTDSFQLLRQHFEAKCTLMNECAAAAVRASRRVSKPFSKLIYSKSPELLEKSMNEYIGSSESVGVNFAFKGHHLLLGPDHLSLQIILLCLCKLI